LIEVAWREVIGQEQICAALQRALRKQQVMHAYLFVGEKGMGKRILAETFAQHLLCNPAAVDACDQCPQCRQFREGVHPDFKLVAAEGTTLKIDQIRELQQDLYLAPYQAAYKVYVILEIEKMTLEAANSLLKALEEPPEHVVFLLTANNLRGVLPTILSRCQVYQLHPVKAAVLAQYLQANYGISMEQAQTIAQLANGNPGQARILLAGQEILREKAFQFFVRMFERNNLFSLAEAMEEHLNNGELLDYFTLYYRDMLIYKVTGDDTLIINNDRNAQLRSFAAQFTVHELLTDLQKIEATKLAIGKKVNPRLALETMLLDLAITRKLGRKEG